MNGKISQFSLAGDISVGEITSYVHQSSVNGGTPTTDYYSYGIFCNSENHDSNNKYVRGIDLGYIDENGNYKLMASFNTPKYDNTEADFWGKNKAIIETGNNSNRNQYAGLAHHRYSDQGTHYYTKFGCAYEGYTPKISFEAWYSTSDHSDARLDCYYDRSNDPGLTLKGTYSTNGYSTSALNLGNTYLYWNGNIIANDSGVSPGSHINKKKNVRQIDFNATAKIKSSDVYSYNYKNQDDEVRHFFITNNVPARSEK